MSDSGNRVGGSTRIPVGDMAKGMIDKIYPHLTSEQVVALNTGAPIPPSPDWPGDRRAVDGPDCGVSAILVFGDKRRRKLAQKAVNQFVRQHHARKQLVVVNATDVEVTTHPHPEILEVKSKPGMIGELRNFGLDHCVHDWVVPCWDDDDYYDPWRLAYQAAHREAGKATLLTTQIRCDITTGAVFTHRDPGGIPNTMMVPRTAARFVEANMSEDMQFLADHFPEDGLRLVIDNAEFPLSGLSIAVYHGQNALPANMFMLDHADPSRAGRWTVGPAEAEHVRTVMAGFGLVVNARNGANPDTRLLP